MARRNGNAHKLNASYKALQEDLASVVQDIENMASSGKDLGLEKAKAQIGDIQDQIDQLLVEAGRKTEDATDEVRRVVSNNPVASLSAAFALGIAAASFLRR